MLLGEALKWLWLLSVAICSSEMIVAVVCCTPYVSVAAAAAGSSSEMIVAVVGCIPYSRSSYAMQ